MISLIQKLSSGTCFFRTRFQLYCPGCGGTRALVALLQGDLLRSLQYNPLTVLFLADFLLMAVLDIIKLVSHRRRIYPGIRLWANLSLLIFLVLYSALRNYLWVVHGIDLLGDFT